jgi:hypothetical protein
VKTLHSVQTFDTFDRLLLRCASVLLPSQQRAEWLFEWESELWHVRRSCTASAADRWQAEREITVFCLGAFQDAACLRGLRRLNPPRASQFRGSATACLAWLAGVLLVSYLLSIVLPGVRVEHAFSSSQVRPGTILIQDEGSENSAIPSMALEQERIWKQSRQHYFDEFAFYRVTPETVQLEAQKTATWQVAQASSNLFSLVGWPAWSINRNASIASDVPLLVLSEHTWRRQFSADPAIFGKILRVGLRVGRVAGVAPDGMGRMPGRADAWLLESETEMAPKGAGYVVAHLTRSGRSELWGGLVRIASYNARHSEHDFLGKSLEQQTPGPWNIYLFAILVAFFALPALTAVSPAEFVFNSRKLSLARRAWRVAFLGAKIALILLIGYFAALDLAYCRLPAFSAAGTYIQLVSTFFICLFGVRWALADQHRRCPVCLRRVAHPANVGVVSRTFLDWSGTELMCAGGHTLLHVPSLPTSWFSTPRWMLLDPSWDFLFAG